VLSSSQNYESLAANIDPDLIPRKGNFSTVADIFVGAADVFKRADRLTVTQVAERYVVIKRLGGRTGHWDRNLAPYMVEPQNSLMSRLLSSTIFVGPSQSGKTESLILNWIAYSVLQDPMDMMIFNPTQQAARDFTLRRVDRLNANSPELKHRLIKARSSDNKSVKQYTSGMIVNFSWPTVSEMAGRPIGRIALTDYDRMADNVGDEGSPFDLARMRTTTFGSFAMTCAESSPSRPVADPRWMPTTPHEAPPTTGILALYNRGDRRRWYWPCFECGYYFEGKFEHLVWEDKENALDAADTVKLACPTCGHKIIPSDKSEMQSYGVWLKDGQSIDPDSGKIIGKGPRSRIASFWLNGVAAGFQTWQELVVKYLNASHEFDNTGSEEALKQFYNNDVGQPYRSKAEELERLPEALQARAEPVPGTEENPEVPEGVRVLVATVDVQRNAFVVQVHGISPGYPYDITIVDRHTIFKSNRFDEDGDRLWVKPNANQEDWELLIDQVMFKTYPLGDGSGRHMGVKLTVCDSGGKEGVTTNAYDFYRQLRREGLASRFHLVKGNPIASAPRTYVDYPDQRRKDKLAAARGDVPVMFLNSNIWKDTLSNRLDSSTPGKGMIHFPYWLPVWFYKELCVERRGEKGWEATKGQRNEAWDLLYYCMGACLSPLLRIDNIDWSNPPSWAEEWPQNTMITLEAPPARGLTPKPTPGYDFAELGKALAS
jgi:phage terminase large subunit GpA-like protein